MRWRRMSRILVVDDLEENRRLILDLFEDSEYTIETASDGLEALERAFAQPPDLVLMDVNMPRLDGFEACIRLKADPRTRLVPVVLVTALSAREDRIKGISAGCDDFLTKPVDLEAARRPHSQRPAYEGTRRRARGGRERSRQPGDSPRGQG